jgi:hypothetical protein
MPLILENRYVLPDQPARRGGHASLYKGTDVSRDNQTVAIKLFNPPNMRDDRVLTAARIRVRPG